jgi:4-hydroxy-tetrahydrodipicolinate synthase
MQPMKLATLSGTFPVIPTPFNALKQVDYQGLENAVNYILSCHVDGVVFPGLASEYAQLTERERLEATAKVGELTRGIVPFVVGAGAPTPEQAIRYAVAGAEAGAVCAMVMAPAQYAQDEAAMISFYKKLAAECGIPIMLQNAPQPMGAGMPIEQVISILQQVPQITYVKEETTPCGQRIETLLANAPKTLKGVFGGAGGRYIMDELNRGALGTVPACELTEVHVALVKSFRQGQHDLARQLFVNMLPILNMQAIFRCSLTKQVLVHRGIIDTAVVRVPGPEMQNADMLELRAFWPWVEAQMGTLGVN